jgi:serine/threonine protein kinase
MEQQKTLASAKEFSTDSDSVASEACLSDDDILAFAKGEVPPQRMESVHSHLDSCNICQQLLTEAVRAIDASPNSETARSSWNTVFQPGAMIAKRYRVLRLIARGGMGEVYEAIDTALHERVALKTVTATHCDSLEAIRLLKAEVQLARRIGHTNVCRIFDLGTHVLESSRSEIQFLVMEYVEGECLGKKLRQSGALALEIAQSVAHQLLLGLAAAHQAGVLHRDFKSDNVMLRSESNGKATAVILDFGLAKALNENGNTVTTRQLQAQAMVGTIGYMAPEQIEGEPLSAASDIYSFGIVWFEMLTGRLPFDGETLAASAVARLHRLPQPPSHYNANVPQWLDDLVLQCLERQRAARFASSEQVLAALAAGPTLSESQMSTRKRSARSPLATVLGLLATASIPAGLALLYNRSPSGIVYRPVVSVQSPETTTRKPVDAPAVQASLRDMPIEGPAQPARHTKTNSRRAEKVSETAPSTLPALAVSSIPIEATLLSEVKPEASVTAPAVIASSEPDWLPLRKNLSRSETPSQVN